ncbi:hypothetical protein HA402_009544 [Bradysia odoriphaga]|nr:hypothetical protein HA402_009544 [Bradysia odoriphaga]
MTALDCTNPFNIPNHSVNNNYPLKRVSELIQAHAKHIGYDLEIGQRICDKCRLFTRNKFVQSQRKEKTKPRPNKKFNRYNTKGKSKTKTYKPPKPNPYMMPESDSSNHNDSNDAYSQEYHQQQAARRRENDLADNEDEYVEYANYSDDDNVAPDEATSSMNDNSNSLHSLAKQNPTTEIKIVNVTSLSAEKHNEILNNDDNAMNATDSVYNHDAHHLKISEIISTAPNSNVFGIAKKGEEPNSLLTISTSKPYRPSPNRMGKKPNSKIQKMKQQLQNNYRLSGAAIPNIDENSTSAVGKVSTDSDEHSNSNVNFKANRRKNTLTPLDCEMEFEEVRPVMKKQAHMSEEQILLSSQLETVKSIKNPNCTLLKKVAFLRVCVNYMMTELEGVKFNFGKNFNFEALKAKYESKRLG